MDIKPLDEWYQRFDDVENLALDLNLKETCEPAARDACRHLQSGRQHGRHGLHRTQQSAVHAFGADQHAHAAGRPETRRAAFFYSSSACVYNGDKQRTSNNPGLKEEDAYPALAEDGYGWEKLFCERMCRHFSEDFGLYTRVARFHNVYGPQGTWDGGREKAPAAICRKVIEAKLSGKHEIEIWGDGNQTRSFMYIDDCIKGIDLIMDSNILEPINLGSSEW